MAKDSKKTNGKKQNQEGKKHRYGNSQRQPRDENTDMRVAASKRARELLQDENVSYNELLAVYSLLQDAPVYSDIVAKLRDAMAKLESEGEIVVNQADQTADTNESVLTVDEGQLPEEERDTPSNFSNNDWLQTYYTEIRALLTDDDDEDENKVTQDEQGVHAELKSGMVLNFVNEDRVQVTTNEDPKADDFKKLVAIAKKHNKAIKLGDHMTDAFREALVVACAQEGVEIKNLPAECEELYKNNKAPEEVLDSHSNEQTSVQPTEKVQAPVNEQEEHVVPQAEAAVSPVAKAVAATPTVNELDKQPEAQVAEDKDTTIARLQALVDNLTRKNESLRQELQFATDGALAATSNDEDQDSAIEAKSREIRELKDQIAQLQAQLAAQSQAGESADLTEINNLVAHLREENENLKKERKQVQDELSQAKDDNAAQMLDLKQQIEALRERLTEASSTVENLKNNPAPQAEVVEGSAVEEAVAEPTVRNDHEAQTAFASVLQGVSQAAQAREAQNAATPTTPVAEETPAVEETPEDQVGVQPGSSANEGEGEQLLQEQNVGVQPGSSANEGEAVVVQEPETPANEKGNDGVPPVAPLAAQATAEGEGTGNGIVVDPDHLEVLHDDRPEDLGARPQASYEREVNYGGPNGSGGDGGDGDGTGGNGNNSSRRRPWYKRWKIWAVGIVGAAALFFGGTKVAASLNGTQNDKKTNNKEKVADLKRNPTDTIVTNKKVKPASKPVSKPDTLKQAVDTTKTSFKPSPTLPTDAPTKWQEGMKVTPRQFTNMYDIELSHDKTGNLWKREWMNASDNETTFNLKPESLIFKVQRLQAWTNVVKGSTCDEHGGQWADANSGAFGDILGPLDQMLKCGEQMDSATIEKAKLLLSAVDDYGYLRKDVLLQLDPNIAKYNSFSADGRLRGTSRYYMTGTNNDCNNSMNEFKKGAAPKVKRPAPKKVVYVQEEPQEEPRQDMPAVDVEKRVGYTINTPVKAPKEQISVNVGASSNSSINMNATDMSQRATDVANRTTSYEYTTTETTQPMNKKELSQAEKMAKKAAAGGVISEEEFLRVKQELDQGR